MWGIGWEIELKKAKPLSWKGEKVEATKFQATTGIPIQISDQTPLIWWLTTEKKKGVKTAQRYKTLIHYIHHISVKKFFTPIT